MNHKPEEITQDFHRILDNYIEQIVSGEMDSYPEIHQIASQLHIHPTHLSNTIKETTGKAPCDICNEKTITIAKKLLDNPNLTIAHIAQTLTFEPTNFTKYFKKHSGQTPSEYRKKR